MAEGKHSGKNFGKVLQKTVFRTREKVLQNLGKADKTQDGEFDSHVTNFTTQQATACKLQKDLKNYLVCVRAMSVASKTFYETLRETYEDGWTGHSEITGAAEALSSIWEDYLIKLTNQVQEPVATYVSRFPDTKHKISKRNRKLMDYDGTRHTMESVSNQKKRDDAKIQKAEDDMTSAKKIYDEINTELHQELPSLYENRRSILSGIFSSLFASEAKFQEESAKIKNSLADVTERLNRESSDVFFKQYNHSPHERGSSSSTPPSDNKLKPHIPNDRMSNRSNKSDRSDQSNHSNRGSEIEKTSRHGSATSDMRAGASLKEDTTYDVPVHHPAGATNGQITKTELKSSPVPAGPDVDITEDDMYENVMINSQTTENSAVNDEEPEEKGFIPKVLVEPTNNNDSKVDDETADDSGTAGDETVYTMATEDEDTYRIPTNNEPVLSESLEPPAPVVLYQVQATHPYNGDDIDELTFDTGDMINVIEFDDPEDQDDGWLMGIKIVSGAKGVFPENFTKQV